MSVLLAVGYLSGACDVSSEEVADSFEFRDSSGVQVAQAPASIFAAAVEWHLGEHPSTTIGAMNGPEEYLLSSVAAAWRREDGRIVVADRRAAQLREYDSGGQFTGAIGGPGEGPGEFQALAMATPYRGDSIATWDSGAQRITVFDRNGEVGRTLTIEFPADAPQGSGRMGLGFGAEFVGAFADGSFAFSPPWTVGIDPGERRAVEVNLARYSPDGTLMNRFGPFVAREVTGATGGSPFLSSPTPFSRPFVAKVGADHLYVGASTEYEVQTLAPDGTVEGLFRIYDLDLSLEADAREQYRQMFRRLQANLGMASQEIERVLEAVSFPSTRPPYADMLIDSDGMLWIQDYELPNTDELVIWRAYDPQGGTFGKITVPAALSLEQVGHDFILAIRTDEFDVQYVEVYPLSRR